MKKVLIISPATLRLNWKREFSKWATRPVRVEIVNGGKPADFPAGDFDVLVINFEVVHKHLARLNARSWDLLVVDEVHRCKNPKAIRTKAILGEVKKGQRVAQGIAAKQRLFLTGTPIVNRPVELWPLVEALDPEGMGKNFFAYAKKFCAAHQTRFGWDFSGASNLDLLQRQLRERFMVRRLKADVLTELPAKRRQVVEIPANGAAEAVKAERAIYDRHEAYIEALEARKQELTYQAVYDIQDYQRTFGSDDPHLMAALGGRECPDTLEGIEAAIANAKKIAFTEMSKARHDTGILKVPHVIEHLTECLESGPVVCFAHHKDVVAAIQAAFPGSVSITGDTPMAERQDNVDAFQAGKTNLFIGNIQAAGVGITLTASAHVVFAEEDWVPGNVSQAEDRCHRIGQKDSVLVQHLVLEGSVDEVMAEKVIAKQEVIDKALDRKAESQAINGTPVLAVEVDDAGFAKEEHKREKVEAEAAAMTLEKVALAHRGLRMIAGMCDGARALDGCGFSKFDVGIGKDLASRATLSPKQGLLAAKFCRKYSRQLPAELVEALK